MEKLTEEENKKAVKKLQKKAIKKAIDYLLNNCGRKEKIEEQIKFLAGIKEVRKKAIFFLSEYFLKNNNLITISDTDEIFIYQAGVYNSGADKILSQKSQNILNIHSDTHFINETLGHIRRTSYKKREKIEEPIDKICLENGILNLQTLKIEEHNPDFIFFNKIPIKYNSKAKCPKIKKFLKEVLVSKADLNVIQELVGYCLYKKYCINKAFLLIGVGANGKSTFINLLKSFLGQENCSAIPLQQLEVDKFSASNLFGKLTNLFADLPARALKETSLFKMLTGEDLISAEKKFKDKFSFTNYAKMIFSANQVPKSPDDSDAFFRRWVMITFPNQFLNDKANKKLIQELTTPKELSGFLNFAIEGLKRLLEQGDFSHSKTIDEVRENYIRQSDSVQAFIMDCIRIKPDNFVQKKPLYTAYGDYCRKLAYPVVPENTFHRELQKKIRVVDYRPLLEIEGKKQRVQCWTGIDFFSLNKKNNPDKSDGVDTDKSSRVSTMSR